MTIGVFNVDVNARKQDYSSLSKDEYLVTKVFPTLQGEGPLAGRFAIFVRLAGCNLGAKHSCPFCDTYFELGAGKKHTAMELLRQAETLHSNGGVKHKLMILTGGEPLLQNVPPLLRLFLDAGWQVQVETNGYFWSSELQTLTNRYSALMIVVSPKVNQRLAYPPLSGELTRSAFCVKVLVDADPQSPYHYLPSYVHKLFLPVYVSPINIYKRNPAPDKGPVIFWDTGKSPLNHERCRENYRYAAALAMQYGFILSCQLHMFAEIE